MERRRGDIKNIDESSDNIQSRTINTLLQNIRIYIDEVHIRLEDEHHGFASGFTLKSAGVTTLDMDMNISDYITKVCINYACFH